MDSQMPRALSIDRPLSIDQTPTLMFPPTPSPLGVFSMGRFPSGSPTCSPTLEPARPAHASLQPLVPPPFMLQPWAASFSQGGALGAAFAPAGMDPTTGAPAIGFLPYCNAMASRPFSGPAQPCKAGPRDPALAAPIDEEQGPGLGERVGSAASEGSALHDGLGSCKPCAWFWKPKGCSLGSACDHCHTCPEGEIKRRRKAKVTAMREAEAQARGQKVAE